MIITRTCAKCERVFKETMLQESHNIPRYLGGKDSDGRRLLCEGCHRSYDKLIVVGCLKFIHEKLEDDNDIIMWQKELTKQPDIMKAHFRNLVKKLQAEFFR